MAYDIFDYDCDYGIMDYITLLYGYAMGFYKIAWSNYIKCATGFEGGS